MLFYIQLFITAYALVPVTRFVIEPFASISRMLDVACCGFNHISAFGTGLRFGFSRFRTGNVCLLLVVGRAVLAVMPMSVFVTLVPLSLVIVRCKFTVFLQAHGAYRTIGTGCCTTRTGCLVRFVGTTAYRACMEVLPVFRCPYFGQLMVTIGFAFKGFLTLEIAVGTIVVVRLVCLAVSCGCKMCLILDFFSEYMIRKLAVCLSAYFTDCLCCAGCGNLLHMCAVFCQHFCFYCRLSYTVRFEHLAAIIAGIVLIVPKHNTSRSNSGMLRFVLVLAGCFFNCNNAHRRNIVVCLGGNGRCAFCDRSYHSVFINCCNGIRGGCPCNFIGGISRGKGCGESFTVTDNKRQCVLVQRNSSGRGSRCNHINSCRSGAECDIVII